MSTLRTVQIQNTSGGNNQTPAQLRSGRDKAWINFDGTNNGIRGSFGVNSLTDNGTGDFTINFSTAFTSANYVPAHAGGKRFQQWGEALFHETTAPTSTAFRFRVVTSNGDQPVDTVFNAFQIEGDN